MERADGGGAVSTDAVTSISLEDAQRRFRALVDDQRARALWHLNPSTPPDIAGPNAESMLNSIALHGTRAVWLEARELKRWRSQHIR
jgi:hypothetical protein